MNFVDYLLTTADAANMHNIISEMAEVWNTVSHGLTVEDFAGHAQYIKDLVYILDFDAVCAWSGLDDFVSKGDKVLFNNTLKAFEHIGFEPAVRILNDVFALEEVHDFYNKRCFFIKMQTLYQIAALEHKLQKSNYNISMWPRLERYVLKEHLKTQKALK